MKKKSKYSPILSVIPFLFFTILIFEECGDEDEEILGGFNMDGFNSSDVDTPNGASNPSNGDTNKPKINSDSTPPTFYHDNVVKNNQNNTDIPLNIPNNNDLNTDYKKNQKECGDEDEEILGGFNMDGFNSSDVDTPNGASNPSNGDTNKPKINSDSTPPTFYHDNVVKNNQNNTDIPLNIPNNNDLNTDYKKNQKIGNKKSLKSEFDGIISFDRLECVAFKNTDNTMVDAVLKCDGNNLPHHYATILKILNKENKKVLRAYRIRTGSYLKCKDQSIIKKGDEICYWDADNFLYPANYDGTIHFDSIEIGVNCIKVCDKETNEEDLIITSDDNDPNIHLVQDEGNAYKGRRRQTQDGFYLSIGSHINVKDGQKVKAGHIVSKFPENMKNITYSVEPILNIKPLDEDKCMGAKGISVINDTFYISNKYGLSLELIKKDLWNFIPININWRHFIYTKHSRNNHSRLYDLVYFQGKANTNNSDDLENDHDTLFSNWVKSPFDIFNLHTNQACSSYVKNIDIDYKIDGGVGRIYKDEDEREMEGSEYIPVVEGMMETIHVTKYVEPGINQCDFSQIVSSPQSESYYITLAPTERTYPIQDIEKVSLYNDIDCSDNMRPFFDVLKKEGIGIVVDIRNYRFYDDADGAPREDLNDKHNGGLHSRFYNCDDRDTAYDDNQRAGTLYVNNSRLGKKPEYLKQDNFYLPTIYNASNDYYTSFFDTLDIESYDEPDIAFRKYSHMEKNGVVDIKNEKDGMHYTPVIFREQYTDETNDIYNFIHFRVKNLRNHDNMTNENFYKLMIQIDNVQYRLKRMINYCNGSSHKIAFHSNGGLGRAPMLMVIRTIWNVFRSEIVLNPSIEFVADWDNQTKFDLSGKINLSAVLKNVMVLGYHARSSFVERGNQLYALCEFVKYLVEQQHGYIFRSRFIGDPL